MGYMTRYIDGIGKEYRKMFKDQAQDIFKFVGKVHVSFKKDEAILTVYEPLEITEEYLSTKSRAVQSFNSWLLTHRNNTFHQSMKFV
jgi:hypothetical protein